MSDAFAALLASGVVVVAGIACLALLPVLARLLGSGVQA